MIDMELVGWRVEKETDGAVEVVADFHYAVQVFVRDASESHDIDVILPDFSVDPKDVAKEL